MKASTKHAVDSILDFTGNILRKYPSRLPGTPDCLSASGDIAAAFRAHCNPVNEERFAMHPGSMWHMGRIISAAYLLSFFLLAAGGRFAYAAAAVNVLALAYAVAHYLLYCHAFDFLFRRKEGCNITATLEPKEPAERQVLLVAHHDSARVFNFLSRFPKLAGVRFLLAMAAYLLESVLSIAAIASGAGHTSPPVLVTVAIGAAFALPLFFFISRKPSPGASDNLIGSALLISLAEHFTETPLKRTRILFLSTDGEECGQCGSQYHAKAHTQELTDLLTRVVNIDSVYSFSDLAILKSDGHGLVHLSAPMAEECRLIADKLGYPAVIKDMTFGSGTDAASFAKAGLEAVSIIAMPTSLFHGKHIYHTANDTLDSIEPEAVEAVFDIIVNYIIKDDK